MLCNLIMCSWMVWLCVIILISLCSSSFAANERSGWTKIYVRGCACRPNECITKQRISRMLVCKSFKTPLGKENVSIYDIGNPKQQEETEVVVLPDRSIDLATVQHAGPGSLFQNGSLYLNYSNKLWDQGDYCVGFKCGKQAWQVVYYTFTPKEFPIRLIANVVSCVFLALVLVVYALLRELRNLRGFLLMSYVGSLLGAYLGQLCYAIVHTRKNQINTTLIAIYLFAYFSIMASFVWTNVMSFAFWSSFSNLTMPVRGTSGEDRRKYRMCCIYGWGAPLVMTLIITALSCTTTDKQFVKPDLLKTGSLQNDARLYYMLVPMAVMLAMNAVLFCLTLFNIRHVRSGSSRLNRKDQNKMFKVYFSLSLMAGLSWTFEIASATTSLAVFYPTDIFNGSIGLVIFLLFVCKANIWRKLAARCRGLQDRSHSFHTDSTTQRKSFMSFVSVTGEQGDDNAISLNPRGPAGQDLSTHSTHSTEGQGSLPA